MIIFTPGLHNLRLLVMSILAAACGSGPVAEGPDASTVVDTPTIAATLRVTGKTVMASVGRSQEFTRVEVSVFRNGAQVPLATTFSGSDASYAVTLTTNGTAIDGYVLARYRDFVDTYFYPPAPMDSDVADLAVVIVTPALFHVAEEAAVGVTLEPVRGWSLVRVVDAANRPVPGAVVSSTPPGIVRYNGSDARPSKTATVTNDDGVAYAVNLPVGDVVFTATRALQSFTSPPVLVRAGVATATMLVP